MTTRLLLVCFIASLILNLVTGCCSPGSVIPLSDFEYVHPSVKWVRCAGEQVGTVLSFPAIIENHIQDIRVDERSVAIQEGEPGCIVRGFLRPLWTVDAEDGHVVLCSAPKLAEYAYTVNLSGDGLEDDSTIRLGDAFELHYEPPYQELLISYPGAFRDEWIRLITTSEMDDSGFVDHCILTKKGRLVFSWGYRHILCVDMNRVKPDLETKHKGVEKEHR